MNSKPEFLNSLNFSLSSLNHNQENNTPKSDTEKKEASTNLIDKYIRFTLHGFFFLLPILFIPFLYDQFTFTRSLLLVIVSSVLFILLGIKFYLKQSFEIAVSKATIYLVVFAIVVFSSVYFSTDRNLSIFGSAGNYYSSLLFYLSVLMLSFFATMQKIGFAAIRKSFVAGVTISTIFAYVSLFKVTVPYFGDLAPQFNLTGSVLMLIGLQVLVSILAMMSFIETPKVSISKLLYGMVFVLTASYLLVVLNLPSAILFFVSLFAVLTLQTKKFNENKIQIGVLIAFIIAIFVVNNSSAKDILRIEKVETQPKMGLIDSWLVSSATAREYPLTGTGLATFSTFYSLHRPVFINSTPNEGLRFVYPSNDLFLILSTMGYIALVVFVMLLIITVKNALSLIKKSDFVYESVALIVSVLVLLVLGVNPILFVILFTLIGMQVRHMGNIKEYKSGPVAAIIAVPGVLVIVFAVLYLPPIAKGQYYYYKALTSNIAESFTYLNQSIASDPTEDVYRRTLVLNNLAIAAQASKRENLTDSEKTQITELLSQAKANAEYLVQRNPRSVANWEVLGTFYKGIIGAVEQADTMAAQSYQNAIRFEPTNPALYVSLGSIYYGQKQYQLAVNAFAQAVSLKQDYANAYYNLAYALKDGGNIEQALIQLQIVDRLIPAGSEDSKKLQENIAEFTKLYEDWAAKVKAAQAQQQGVVPPADAEKTNPEALKPTPQQEPLVSPEEKSPVQVQTEEKLNLDENAQPTGTEETLPAADGSNVNPDQGQVEAPLAKPAE